LLGIGNSGRQDDALGWAFVDAVAASGAFAGETGLRYQLQVEDAELISHYDHVIFVDAFQGELPGGFSCKTCPKAMDVSFSTHELAPETVRYLCEELYDKHPQVDLLLIQGRRFELGLGLTEPAQQNLANAQAFFSAMSGNNAPACDAAR
jgi:hydrogenase maturation protease